ncbi:MAG: ribonuclease HI family protein [bacterium]|nr:ribonuclease HI family protein [bacterium]
MNKMIVYTDGGSRGNPGPAGIGVAIMDEAGNLSKSYSKFLGRKTNNEAEYEAVIFALEKIRSLLGKEKSKKMEVDMRMDSQLVARQLNGEYKIENERLAPLFIKIWNLKLDFNKVNFTHVPREQNKDADRLANEAMDGENEKLF